MALLLLLVADTLTLETAVQRALDANPSLSARESRTSASRWEWYRNLSTFGPSLTMDARYSKSSSVINIPGSGGALATSGYNATLTLSQPIFNMTNLTNAWGARAAYAQALADEEDARQELVYSVVEGYFECLKWRETLRLRETQVRVAEENLNLVAKRRELKGASRAELLDARATYNTAELNLIRAKQSVAAADAKLLGLVGGNPAGELEIAYVTPDTSSKVPDLETLVAVAERKRASLVAYRSLASKGKANYYAAATSFLPDVNFGYYWIYSEDRFPWTNFFEDARRSSGVYVSLYFDLTGYPFRLFQQKHTAAAGRLDYEAARLAAVEEIADYRDRLLSASAALAFAREAEEAREAAFELASERFRLGAVAHANMVEAEEKLTQAEIDLISAVLDVGLARELLERAVGGEL